jgi:hypothetical protein
MDMARSRSWNALVACVGLAAYVGMLLRVPVLVQWVQSGMLSLTQAAPTVIGALLLLVASFGLLLRRPARGGLLALSMLLLLAGRIGLPAQVFSFWPWLAVAAALAGALLAFLPHRGTPAA